MKYTFFVTLSILSFCLQAQFLKKDSLLLTSIQDENIRKVVFKNDNKNLIAIGWQSENLSTINIYLQTFNRNGFAVTEKKKIASVPIAIVNDFDFEMNSDGNFVFTWSEYDATIFKYNIYYKGVDNAGNVNHDTKKIGTSPYSFVNSSMNSHDQFLISWKDNTLKIQLFDKDFNADGDIINPYLIDLSTPHPLELTDSTHIAYSWKDETGTFLTILDKQGKVINYNRDQGNNICCSNTFDMDFDYPSTVFSYSNTGTYISLNSRFTGEENDIKIDNANSSITRVKQNNSGSTFVGWLSPRGLKARFYTNSGSPVGDTLIIWNKKNDLMPNTFDTRLSNTNEATIVYTINSSIYMQTFQYQPPIETREMISNPPSPFSEISQKVLSGTNTHIVFWQHKEKNRSAIFAQLYDKTFNKTGEVLNLTGFKNHEDIYDDTYFKFDCAIDSIGNFFIVWKSLGNSNIYGKKYNAVGDVIKEEIQVNEASDEGNDFPKIASNKQGEFIVVWRSDYLYARLISEEYDSGEKVIKECCFFQPDYSDGAISMVSMNDDGRFVYGYQKGYYDLSLLIYDKEMLLINEVTHEDVFDTFSQLDLNLSNHNQIVVAWTRDNLIRVRRFNGLGNPIESAYVLDDSGEALRAPALGVNYKGDYCVLYQDRFPTTANYIQKFTTNGKKDGNVLRVNTFLSSFESDIAYNSDHDIFASWSSGAYSGLDVIVKGFSNKNYGTTEALYYYVDATITSGDSLKFGKNYLKKEGRYSNVFKIIDSPDSVVILTLKLTYPDIENPTLISLIPANGAVNVDTETSFVLNFSENILLGNGRLHIFNADNDIEIGEIILSSSNTTITNAQATITSPNSLPVNTAIYIQADNGSFKDLSNNNYIGISSSGIWTFKTAVAPDHTPPLLVSTLPTMGTIQADSSKLLKLTFNEYIKLLGGQLTVLEDGPDNVLAQVNLQSSNTVVDKQTVTVSLPQPLPSNKRVYVHLTSTAIADTSGNNFNGIADKQWVFSTSNLITAVEDTVDGDLHVIQQGNLVKLLPGNSQIFIHNISNLLGQPIEFERSGNVVSFRNPSTIFIVVAHKGERQVTCKFIVRE